MNVYAYARNNPLKYVDPTGEFFTPETAVDAVTTGYDVGNGVYQVGQTIGTGLIYALGTFTGNQNYIQVAEEYWAEDREDLSAAATDIVIDGVATAIPFVPAVVSKTDDVAKAVKKVEGVLGPLTQAGRLTREALENSNIIAGVGKDLKPLQQAGRLVKQYGGEIKDWFKKTTKHFFDNDGKKYQIHYYENKARGELREGKIKYSDDTEIRLDW